MDDYHRPSTVGNKYWQLFHLVCIQIQIHLISICIFVCICTVDVLTLRLNQRCHLLFLSSLKLHIELTFKAVQPQNVFKTTDSLLNPVSSGTNNITFSPECDEFAEFLKDKISTFKP